MPNDQAAEFNLADWINDARLPEVTVTLCGRPDLLAEHQRLTQELTKAPRDDRMSDAQSRLARNIIDVEKTMIASQISLTIRAVTDTQLEEAEAAAAGDNTQLSYLVLSAQCVDPVVAPNQWPLLRDKIGLGQFNAISEAATQVNSMRSVSVPFSQAAWSKAAIETS